MLTHVRKLTHTKNFDPRKDIFDPRNPGTNYDPCDMLTHVKIILTQVNHVKFDPRNARTHGFT